MSSESAFRWDGHALVDRSHSDPESGAIAVADSLLVSDGHALALDMHRTRFRDDVSQLPAGTTSFSPDEVDTFLSAAFAKLPEHGNWFPRVELRTGGGSSHLWYRHRPAPVLTRSVTLATYVGDDPRRVPAVKGPDIETLGRIRRDAGRRGVDDVVFVTANGHIIDGAANALMWWRGETLCAPPRAETDPAFARVASVTSTALLGLAFALGVHTNEEATTPAELDGSEVWAVNALHGIRMVTNWENGPQLAEKPGRIGVWRDRLRSLRSPIGELAT